MKIASDGFIILVLGSIFSIAVVLTSFAILIYEVRLNGKRDCFYKNELTKAIKNIEEATKKITK